MTFKWNRRWTSEAGRAFIQYSHARAQHPRKAPAPVQVVFPPEREGGGRAGQEDGHAPYVVRNAATELKPHYVADLRRELAESFNQFYRFVPVLSAEPGVREARLALALCRPASRWLASLKSGRRSRGGKKRCNFGS